MRWLADEASTAAIDTVERRLDEAIRAAPEDDRVWLGHADLALRKEQFVEAGDWLRKCQARRPDDPVVWRARLEWATASGNVDEATEAMRHVPIGSIEPERLLATRAWLAARRETGARSMDALAHLLDRVPGDSRALERLIDRASRTGQAEEAARLRRRKSGLGQAAEEYRRLLDVGVPTGQFDRLGGLAETLGRWFEARGWWTLAARDRRLEAEARRALERIDRIGAALRWRGARGDDLPRCGRNTAGPPGRPTGREAGRRGEPADRGRCAGRPHDRRQGPDPAGRPPAVMTFPYFRDDAHAAGLDFVYDNDPTPLCRLPETMMGGVGLLDYDGDGWLDVYAVQGGPLDGLSRTRGSGTGSSATGATARSRT